MNSPRSHGLLVVISSPSGAGKNTIIRRLTQIFSSSVRFVTTTTRNPRPREIQGEDYFFVAKEQFKHMIQEEKFIEYNEYAGEYYGSEKEKLNHILEKYALVFAALDVNGKLALEALDIPHVSIFILPESEDILRQRIQIRGGVEEEGLEQRLALAEQELALAQKYDFQVVNAQGDMETAVQRIADFLRTYLDK